MLTKETLTLMQSRPATPGGMSDGERDPLVNFFVNTPIRTLVCWPLCSRNLPESSINGKVVHGCISQRWFLCKAGKAIS
jgi:hypothetical protein